VPLTDHASAIAHLERPAYSYAEADRIAGATRGTTKRWTRGYAYRTPTDQRVARPPVTPGIEHPEAPGASFLDLVEVAAIARLKELGLSLGQIRGAVDVSQTLLDLRRPLVTERFRSDGRSVFVQQGDVLVELGFGPRKGRQAWDEVIGPFLETVEYESELVRRWWPLGRTHGVVIDPDFGFGLPVIADSGVRTEIVLEQIEAGVDPASVARDFGISRDDVDYALAFEATRRER
jgi:uncharacterized protein (DUF433 family)